MVSLPSNLTERQPNTQYVASISYGKDSLAMLEAIKILGLPLDRIIHADVWATDEISADLPPMVAFKEKADRIIKERYGIEVEHVCARDKDGNKITYEKLFYKVPKRKPNNKKFAGGGVRQSSDSRCARATGARAVSNEQRYGFPVTIAAWCRKLKIDYLEPVWKNIRFPDLSAKRKLVHGTQTKTFSSGAIEPGAKINTVQYLGIAADEPERIKKTSRRGSSSCLDKLGRSPLPSLVRRK